MNYRSGFLWPEMPGTGRSPCRCLVTSRLEGAYVLGFRAFAPLADLELDPLIVEQGLLRRLDIRSMDEEIVAAVIRLDKPIALLIIEKLNRTCCQNTFSSPSGAAASTM